MQGPLTWVDKKAGERELFCRVDPKKKKFVGCKSESMKLLPPVSVDLVRPSSSLLLSSLLLSLFARPCEPNVLSALPSATLAFPPLTSLPFPPLALPSQTPECARADGPRGILIASKKVRPYTPRFPLSSSPFALVSECTRKPAFPSSDLRSLFFFFFLFFCSDLRRKGIGVVHGEYGGIEG